MSRGSFLEIKGVIKAANTVLRNVYLHFLPGYCEVKPQTFPFGGNTHMPISAGKEFFASMAVLK